MSVIIKKYLIFISLLFVFQLVAAQVKIEKSSISRIIDGKEYYIHYVEKGQTLYSISRVYDVTIDELIFENPTAKNQLLIGQELKIPKKSRDKEVEESLRGLNNEYFYHITKEGESLRSIARSFYVSYRDLTHSNLELRDPLKIGQYVKIPVNSTNHPGKEKKVVDKQKVERSVKDVSEELPKYIDHIVEKGESLYRIARKFKVSLTDIKNANPYVSERNLSIGQYLKIPTAKIQNEYISHKADRRERLNNLAREYDVDVDLLKEANPRLGDRLRRGQIVKIPVNSTRDLSVKKIMEQEPKTEEIPLPFLGPVNQDSLACYNPENMMQTYKVALLIPLYLEEVDSLKFTEETILEDFMKEAYNPFRFIPYYYGARMAIDSLMKQGLKLEFYVYDVDNKIAKTVKVLNNPELQQMDLIIGPFFKNPFEYATRFAQIFKIPIVNPLSKRPDVIENNPFVFKTYPTDEFTLDMVEKLIASHYTDSKIFLIKQHQKLVERDYPDYLERIKPLLDSGYYVSNDELFELILEKSLVDTSIWEDEWLPYIDVEGQRIYTDSLEFHLYDSTFIENKIIPYYYSQDSAYVFEKEASIFRKNAVIIFSDENEKVFALDLMTKLNVLKDTFPTEIIGIPNWRDYDNMDNELLNNLYAHVLSAEYINYRDYRVNNFVADYRKKYLTEPHDFAFKGFDVFYYFLKALMNFGKDFYDCIPYYNPKTIQTDFEFFKRNQKDGYDNKSRKFLMYNNYRLNAVDLEVKKPLIDSAYKENIPSYK